MSDKVAPVFKRTEAPLINYIPHSQEGRNGKRSQSHKVPYTAASSATDVGGGSKMSDQAAGRSGQGLLNVPSLPTCRQHVSGYCL